MNSDQLETTKETTIEKSNAKYGHVPAKKKAKLSSNRDVDGSIDGVENSLSDTKHGHGGCHFYLSTKSRYCPQQVKEGRKYCPHHASAIPTPAKETKEPTEAHGIRVPCPYDPTHGVFVYKLQRHLQVCNKRPIERHDPFYACDLNAGEDSEDDETMKPTSDPKTDLQELIASAKAHGEANGSGVEQPVRRLKKKQTESLLHKLSGTQIMDLVKKVETLAAEILPPIGDDFTDSQECLRAFGSLEGRNMKHISQISHMISIMQKHNMCTPDTVCLEFGAGKGTLSQMIHTVFKCGTLLIDRKGFRQKVDRFERQNEGFQRIKIDIKDLNLAGVDSISHKPVIAVGKHLCGCATDLTLRCFHTHPRSQIDGLVHGVCIALCCHHICNWKSYVNKEYVKNVLQLTRDEFEILCKMTSWAVCGSRGALNLDKRNPASPFHPIFVKRSSNFQHVLNSDTLFFLLSIH
eukprot:TRINITY_DN5772_c0_g1_i4.p1 TRINITY_DN5772_c0_g1~~TRINITY_DN5772_c0_g1_i4.p1  ORF type:complete len:463 (+),score=80.79 TRINITY_DN5772_c0_g1_i4:43-1431(+)